MLHSVANIKLFIQKVQDKICVCCVPFLTIYVIVGASIAALLVSIVCMQLVVIVSSRTAGGGGWISAFTGEWSATATTILLTIQHFYYCEVCRQVRYCCCQVVMKCRHQATTMTCWSSNRQLLPAKLKERKTGLSLGKKKTNLQTNPTLPHMQGELWSRVSRYWWEEVMQNQNCQQCGRARECNAVARSLSDNSPCLVTCLQIVNTHRF